MDVQWFKLTELFQASTGTAVWPLCERMLRSWLSDEPAEVLRAQWLAELTTELSACWAAVWTADEMWTEQQALGRRPARLPSPAVLSEALDRESVALYQTPPPDSHVLVVPTLRPGACGEVLLFAAQRFSPEQVARAAQLTRTLGYCFSFRWQRERLLEQAELYRRLSLVVARFTEASETVELLKQIAEGATELLHCERASIFVWDREHGSLVACPALGVPSGTLRVPEQSGIVGQVLKSGRPIRVADAYQHPHFDRSFDTLTGFRTRSVLCVPMKDADGKLVGAFQALNKLGGGSFTEQDEECLTLLGRQATVALKSTREREALLRSHRELTERAAQGGRLIGESPEIRALRQTVERLAQTDLPVLILGESGTGKEVVARALHYQGPRAGRPFVAVNCAALNETLLETELFGHERGAFTDARETRQGKFEVADGGTLFLDEIGEMSLAGQAKLLRVLEQKTVTRVGGTEEIPVDVRVIAATNANLQQAVKQGKFREDLFYRLNVVVLELSPLRERPEDVIPLAEHFLEQFAAQAGRPPLKLSPEAQQRLKSYTWPGNVRELRNLMERFAFLATSDTIEAEDLGFLLSPQQETDLSLAAATRRFQEEYIRRAIKRAGGNMSEAAKLLGLHRANLYRKMKQLGMKPPAPPSS